MPFLGKSPTAGFSTIVKDDLTPDGSTTAFTLSKNVASANDIAVFVGNVRQEPTDAYSVSGTTLTMTAAPASGLNFYVLHIAGTLESSVVPADNTISSAKLQSNLSLSGDLTVGNRFTIEPAARAGVNEIRSYNNYVSSYMELHFDASSFRFYDSANGTHSSSTEALRVNDLGVSFDAGSNYLDDYEEGTFTPTIYGTSGGTPVNGSGFYTKIGNTVKTTVEFINVNMSTGGHTGTLRMGGLPFASANQKEVAAVPMTYNVAITGTDKYNIGLISDNSTTITYYRIRDLSSWTGTPVPTGSTVYLYSTFTYTTSA